MSDETATVNPQVPSETGTLPVYEVLIERSINEVIGAEVFAYEIPVLKLMHGEDRVQFKGYPPGTELEDVEPAFEVEAETDANHVLIGLRNKYIQNGQPDVVFPVYRDAAELAQKAGLTRTKGGKSAPPQSENIDLRKKAKKSASKSK